MSGARSRPRPGTGNRPDTGDRPDTDNRPAFGVYVHVPFCARRCDYCAFSTFSDRDHLMERYAQACITEIERALVAGEMAIGAGTGTMVTGTGTGTMATGAGTGTTDTGTGEMALATSVFFGGGTPSRLPPQLLAEILGAIPRTADAEVTAECNPEDASEGLLRTWRTAGVNRVSFGVQSMVPHVLRSLGRRHDPASVERALVLTRDCGFESANVDLILGASAENDGDLVHTLHSILGSPAAPEHISAYCLTVEPGTPLSKDRSRHPDDDTQARRYAICDRILESAGYRWYEISNWAAPGHECRHNILYWSQGNYRGIGSAAHSHLAGRRWWNVAGPDRYIEKVRRGVSPIAAEETLGEEQRILEGLALSLRTSVGVPASALPDEPELDHLVRRAGDRAVLTLEGRLLANEVALRPSVTEQVETPSRA